MDLYTELATICCTAKLQKQADEAVNPSAVRDDFEHSVSQEQVLRRHAARLQTLAKSRASEEDMSAGGYANTVMDRMLPVPHTATEAAVRLPLVGAGAYLGHQYGKNKLEPINPTDLHKALVSKGKGGGALESALSSYPGIKKPKLKALIEAMRVDPDAASGALHTKLNPFGGSAAEEQIGKQVAELLPKGGVPTMRREIQNVVSRGEKGVMGAVGSALKPHRLLGAAGGAAAASLITGLPLAIRAAVLKRRGGEAAVRAETAMQRALSDAESLSTNREGLLAKFKPQEGAHAVV